MSSFARSLHIPASLLMLCLLCAGCGSFGKSMNEMSRLHAGILKKYSEKDVGVNLHNSSLLTVTFINSPLNAKSPEERALRAQETAAFVVRNYPSINQIEEIWVSFLHSESRFIVVSYSKTLEVYGFDKEARALGPPGDSGGAGDRAGYSPTSLEPVATYSPQKKETEVIITRLQLEGDLEHGLALVPHFKVPGDATGVRRSSIFPESVVFDFASYSDNSMFPGDAKITALADRSVVFETRDRFSGTRLPTGGFTEFLQIEVPYPAFHQMVSGKKLTLRLGDREFELTNSQIKALRKMTEYVKAVR